MDWLLERQDAIERRLAKRHLADGALVLYDLTSSYLEGRRCPLAKRGHCRDGKRGKLQIEFGLLCDQAGCPVAVEVFDGNTADPMTVGAQIDTLRRRFGLHRVVLVGDRGMLTEARIREDVKPAGLDWISALRSSAIRELVESGAVQMSLFDDDDAAAAEAARPSVVAPAAVSESAREKARSKRTADGLPVHSFRTLLGDLATVAKNRVVPKLPGSEPFYTITRPTKLQRQALALLGVRL